MTTTNRPRRWHRLGWAALPLSFLACSASSTAAPPVTPAPSAGDATDAPATLATTTDEGVAAPWGIAAPEDSPPQSGWGILDPTHAKTVHRVSAMVGDHALRQQVQRRGLGLMNVMWEDTGRFQGSSVGPNISDVTLQVRFREPGGEAERAALMPVIRFPNFTDRTGDVSADRFFVRVGNEHGGSLRTVALTDVLRDVRSIASHPESILGSGNLLAPRDSHFLVSAQAVFLPVPKKGKAEFNPVVFNYQSAPSSPAVLTLLVTRQGTSMTVIENRAEDSTVSGAGQELYFNAGGKRAAFTAERFGEVKARIQSQGGPASPDDASALESGADVMFLVQVPLKHRPLPRPTWAMDDDFSGAPPPAAPGAMEKSTRRRGSDVERAVLGHGRKRGPFREGRNLKLVRDERFPVRITVQFYKATSNGVVSEGDLDQIAKTIGGVYEHADFVGSLVVPQGDPIRPTAWSGPSPGWLAW